MTGTESTSPSPARLTPEKMAAAGSDPQIGFDGRHLALPFFDTVYTLTGSRVYTSGNASPPDKISEILIHYVLNYPPVPPPNGRLVSFRELGGAGPLVVNFANNTNKTITTTFTGRLSVLESAARALGGRPQPGVSGYDLALAFRALPGVPLYLQFNDAQAPFPAQSSLLLDASIETYLDMHAIFTLGTFLCGRLVTAFCKEH